MGHFGLAFGKPKIELDKLREWKNSVVEKSVRGLSGLAKPAQGDGGAKARAPSPRPI